MKRIPKAVQVTAFALLLATCGVRVALSTTAPPVTVPLDQDVVKARRVALSRVGGPDTRADLPAPGDRVGGNGVVEPIGRETRVAAQLTAVVSQVAVKEGQWVEAGELLVQLANEAELAVLQASEAELAAQRANLTRTLRGLRIEDREAVASETQAAKARADLAAEVRQRTEALARAGAVSADELDRARRNAQSEQATYQATEARLRAAEAGSRKEDVALARAGVHAAEAKVAQSQATLDRLAVRAPTDGEVLQVKVREGELYSFMGMEVEPLVVLGDTRTLRVRMDVDERDIARVKLGAKAWVTADAFGSRRFPGKVVEIGRRFGRKNIQTDDPIEKNDTKILEVLLELDEQGSLVPGQRVTSYVVTAPLSQS